LFRSEIFFRAKYEICFQNLTLGYMTKTLNQIICFFLHQNQNIFLSNIGNQNIFLVENHNPFQVKWSVPNKSFKAKVSQNVNLQQLKFEIF
jgi:ribonucleotide reductase beta subunit family protein with ferritin-like domain